MIEPIVLNRAFERIGLIDTYSSLIWATRYYSCGDFEIVVPADETHIELLKRGFYIVREDDENVGIVEDLSMSIDEDQNEQMIVTGRFLPCILGRRIIATQTQLYGTVSAGIEKLIDDAIVNPTIAARKISNFTVAPTTFPARLEAQYTGKNLLETVEGVCETNHLGFKVTLETSDREGMRTSEQLFDERRVQTGFITNAAIGSEFEITSTNDYPNAQYAEINVTGIDAISYSCVYTDANHIRIRFANEDNFCTGSTSSNPSQNDLALPDDTTKIYVMFLPGYTGEERFMINEGSMVLQWETYREHPSKDFKFTLFQGVDRSYDQSENPHVVFSDEYDNLLTSAYEEQSSELVTDVLVAGEGEGLDRKTLWVSRENPTGLDRYELYHDQRNMSTNDGEIKDEVYMQQMKEEGLEQITAITSAFNGTVYFDNIKYRQDVNVGDIVTIENKNWGLFTNCRLIEVIESVDEAGSYEIVPTFGA